jgi:hypothetical protein
MRRSLHGTESRQRAKQTYHVERTGRSAARRSGARTRRVTREAHHASNCRWAVPTLFLPAPFWWAAEARPWSCVRHGTPRVLETTEACAGCPSWEPRTDEHFTAPVTGSKRSARRSAYLPHGRPRGVRSGRRKK